jgi:hypothetical protein
MKVNATVGKPGFAPITLVITLETEREAQALRAAGGGITREAAKDIFDRTLFATEAIEAQDIANVLRGIEDELFPLVVGCSKNEAAER